jgi:CRP/FNR family transcriptional regulator
VDKWLSHDVELIIVPLSLMEKWMTEHSYECNFLRTEFDLKNYWKLSIISRLEQCLRQFYLKRNADASGSKDLKLSHPEIATELNTSREVISRLLKKWNSELVKLHRNHIEILNQKKTVLLLLKFKE